MYNQEEYQSLILAALLHDIGKFYQRTGAKLGEEDKRLMASCCPVYKGEYSHQHVLYSGIFFREVLDNKFQHIENIVLYHHCPESAGAKYRNLVKILTLADWLSSGERREKDDISEAEVANEPLISIFSSLFPNKREIRFKYVPLHPLSFDLTPLFPKEDKSDAIKDDSYSTLWKAFTDEMGYLKDESNLDLLIEQLQFVLHKFTFTVPSAAYVDRPDITLYHHLKTTAAICACLYHLGMKEDEVDKILNAIKNETHEILNKDCCILLAADLSGIQDFIYSITSEHALKSIKGRSFYLQLISDSFARSILNRLNLPPCNIIFIGGGNLYLLLPNTESVIREIEEFKDMLSANFLYAHRGELVLQIAYEKVKYSDFMGLNFGNLWNSLKGRLATEKRKKFSAILDAPATKDMLLGPYDTGGEREVCQVCGEELKHADNTCSLCKSFEQLAYDLPRARYIQEFSTKPMKLKEQVRDWEKLLTSIGTRYKLVQDPPQDSNAYTINNTDYLSGRIKYKGFYFFAHNAPRIGDRVKMLDEIAGESKGVERWGVLRVDVDDLGKTFAEGLGDKDRTISRIAMLSEMLGLFFSVQVEKIAREPEYTDKIYVIYSGGDDLFIIGPWSILPDFALRLYDDFRRYTAESLTLSGSIFIAPTKKFPVYQSAYQAKEDLELAKTDKKNKLTFLGIPVPWDSFNELKGIMERITFLLDEEGPNLPHSLLQILNFGWIEIQRVKKGEVPVQRIWRFLYAMKRLKERHKDHIGLIDDLEKAVIVEEKKGFKEYLEVPVRWAELLTRKEV